MTLRPAQEKVDALLRALKIDTPVIAVNDTRDTEGFAPVVELSGINCCFAYYPRWLKGETLVLSRDGGGCPGGLHHLGLKESVMPNMEHFLTDGVGAPSGEGLKATPAIAKEMLDKIKPVRAQTDNVLIGPLRIEKWESVRTLSFFVDIDPLAALMTLAGYWSAADTVVAPFGSGCSLLWRSVEDHAGQKAVIGGTDIAMRKYLPPNIIVLTVSPQLFYEMVNVPEGSFLERNWWADLMKSRGEKAQV